MNDRQVSVLGLAIAAGMIALLFALTRVGEFDQGISASVSSAIDALPASGAGLPSAPAQAAYLGGTLATGRVAQVYVKVAENVFLELNQAPQHLRTGAERWVDVQFPELLANGTGAARAILERSEAGVEVGAVVEIKFAHKHNPRFFPVKEHTRVTALVASKNQMLAKDFERRILARNGHGASAPQWLSQASVAASAPSLPHTTTASAGR